MNSLIATSSLIFFGDGGGALREGIITGVGWGLMTGKNYNRGGSDGGGVGWVGRGLLPDLRAIVTSRKVYSKRDDRSSG